MRSISEIKAKIQLLHSDYDTKREKLETEISLLRRKYEAARDALTTELFIAICEQRDVRAMNVKECSEYLGVSEGSIRKSVAEKSIPFFRVGESVRFSKMELDRWKRGEWRSPMEELANIYLNTKRDRKK